MTLLSSHKIHKQIRALEIEAEKNKHVLIESSNILLKKTELYAGIAAAGYMGYAITRGLTSKKDPTAQKTKSFSVKDAIQSTNKFLSLMTTVVGLASLFNYSTEKNSPNNPQQGL